MVLGVVYVTHCQWWLSVQPYDEVAIFTGSTTIVDGKMVIIYPGLCVKGIEPDCDTGTLLAGTTRTSFLLAYAQLCSLLTPKAASLRGALMFSVAVPADPSDPLYTNWTKPSYNPIMKNTQRDPSTAWKTPAGEWRITTYDTTAYGSTDFVHWTRNGHTPGFPVRVVCRVFGSASFNNPPHSVCTLPPSSRLSLQVGECPSFYPLPPLTPAAVERRKRLGVSKAGAAVAAATDASSTRVHKCSHGGKDWTRVGSYVAGPVGSPGNFSAAKGYPFQPFLLDAGDMCTPSCCVTHPGGCSAHRTLLPPATPLQMPPRTCGTRSSSDASTGAGHGCHLRRRRHCLAR